MQNGTGCKYTRYKHYSNLEHFNWPGKMELMLLKKSGLLSFVKDVSRKLFIKQWHQIAVSE